MLRPAVLLLAGATAALGCAPLPDEPAVRGPSDDRAAVGSRSATRELVWFRQGTEIRVSRASKLCTNGQSARAECIQLSAADRRELDRFFGAETFRQRWKAYIPCAGRNWTTEVFEITFADGESIARPLDTRFGDPRSRTGCDQGTRQAVSAIGDNLLRQYFR
jgi:hypothetical protein